MNITSQLTSSGAGSTVVGPVTRFQVDNQACGSIHGIAKRFLSSKNHPNWL